MPNLFAELLTDICRKWQQNVIILSAITPVLSDTTEEGEWRFSAHNSARDRV